MKKNVFIVFICFILVNSCSYFPCGSPKDEWQKLLKEAKKKYSDKVEIRIIPCESIYLDIILKDNNIDTLDLDHLHKLLYNQSSKIGWQTINVYNKNGQYIFSHSFEEKIFIQSGD